MADLLFVTGTPASVRGGSGTFVGISVLAGALREAGHRVEVLAPGEASTGLAPRLLFNLRARGAARQRAARFDAVVGFDLDGLFVSAPGALHVASIKGVIADEMRFERGATRLALRAAAVFERRHVRAADLVLTTSAYAARRIAEAYGVARGNVAVVPEPIDLERWQSALSRARRFEPPAPVILCVAHLYPRKRVAALVRAMALLERRAVLRVVGTGPEERAIAELVGQIGLADRVELLGHVDFDTLVGHYRSADLFCLPSEQEGFGIVFLEAMAAGLPVVACEVAAIPEVVPNGRCGLLVPPGDEQALARALDRLLSDGEERRQMGEAGRLHAARYDAPIVALEFLRAIGLAKPRAAQPEESVS